MFNLLPKEDKETVRTEYSRRFISVALGGLLFVFIVNTVLLVPFLMNVYRGSKNTKDDLNTLKNKTASNDYRELEATIKETKTAINLLKTDMSERLDIANIIAEALTDKPKGILINNISWFNDGSDKRLKLSGVASVRETLRKYILTLQANKTFSGVDGESCYS